MTHENCNINKEVDPLALNCGKYASSPQPCEVDPSCKETSSFVLIQQQSCSLSEYKLRRLGIKNYQCNTCNKSFFRASDLEHHTLGTHMGIRKHKCDVCDKSFRDAQDLSDHKLLHDGIIKYQCDCLLYTSRCV